MQLKCSQVHKHSKYICKTVHVTSVAQLQFCKTTIILFLCKENKNNNLLNHSSPPSYVFRTQERIWCNQRFFKLNESCYELCLRLGESVRMNCDTLRSKLLFLFSLHKKSILVASQTWSWATDVTWTVLQMYLLRLWTWEHFRCFAVCAGSESSLISSKIL